MNTLKLTDNELEILLTYYELGKNLKDQTIQTMVKQIHAKNDLEVNKDVVWLKLHDLIDPTGEFAKLDYGF
tara:strand:+ start:248 stop:460 length:213 start_codon:yes stop_codon:yes gene_type:complete